MFSRWFISRIKEEKNIMAKELSQFLFLKRGDEYSFEGWHTTTTSRLNFVLKLPLPTGYPDVMPALYVSYPTTLRKYGGGTINSLGTSHAFHTFRNWSGGCVQICHGNTENWDASKTCIGVLFKGMLWCEAYAVHLRTGLDISEILDNWRRRQISWKEKEIGLSDLSMRWLEERT